jgi:MYXO-CTERM domain-containing protein
MRALASVAFAALPLLFFSMPATAAARAYGAAGSNALAEKSLSSSARLVAPATGGPYPLIVASHGFSASGDNQIGWARHFASWGFVVAVPTFASPLAPDTAANAAAIQDLVTQLQGPLASSEHVAKGAFGLEGHSAGGLATAAAAAKLVPGATVLFDPVDKDGVGKAAYGTLCAPVLAIFAGASSCNNNAEWRGFAKSAPGDLLAFDVKGSTHCDGENAARALCGSFCGGAANADRQAAYAHYATAFFLSRLKNDAAATAVLAPGVVDADPELDAATHGVATCSSPGADAGAEAGTSGGPSVSPDGGGPAAAPPAAAPTAPGGGDATTPASDSGCGCRTVPAPASSLAGLVLTAAALLAVRRRRR